MNTSILLLLALAAFGSTASFYGTKSILVNEDGTKIVAINDDGKAVQIESDKIGVIGNRVIQVQVSGPNRVTKTVRVNDRTVDTNGITQSQVLAQIFSTFQGTVNENAFNNLLNTISKLVAAGKIDQDIIICLEVLSLKNDDVVAQNTLNQILEEEEEIQKLLEQQIWKDKELNDAQKQVTVQQGLQLGQNGLGSVSSVNNLLRDQQLSSAQEVLKEEQLKRASVGEKTVLLSDDSTKIVVINENGKAIKIQTDKVGVRGNRVIQIQVTIPQKATKTAIVYDKIVTEDGWTESAKLAKIFSNYEGTLNEDAYKDLLNRIAYKVTIGKINPTVLVALQLLDNDVISARNKLRQLLQEEEFKTLATDETLKNAALVQGGQTVVQQAPWGDLQSRYISEGIIKQRAIDQAVNQQQKKQQKGQLFSEISAVVDNTEPQKRNQLVEGALGGIQQGGLGFGQMIQQRQLGQGDLLELRQQELNRQLWNQQPLQQQKWIQEQELEQILRQQNQLGLGQQAMIGGWSDKNLGVRRTLGGQLQQNQNWGLGRVGAENLATRNIAQNNPWISRQQLTYGTPVLQDIVL